METDTNAARQTDAQFRDDSGLAGLAVGVDRVDGEETPGIVRGTEDVAVGGDVVATRVLVETDGGELINTDADRVEVI